MILCADTGRATVAAVAAYLNTRRHRRCAWKKRVLILGSGWTCCGEINNISEGGISVALFESELPELQVNILIGEFLKSAAIVLRALLRHRNGRIHGFEFTSMTPAQAGLLHTLCQSLPN